MKRRLFAMAVLWALGCPVCVRAQTDYMNIDAGRPLRMESASVTPTYSLDIQFPAARMDRFASGVTRIRTDPELAYGIAPFTEVSVRLPILYVIPPSSSGPRTLGLAGISFGAAHTFGPETGRPAFALGVEALLPAGSLSAPATTYSLEAALTRTLSDARIHLNAGLGRYSVNGTVVDTTCRKPARFPVPGTDYGCGAPVIPDVPCSIAGTSRSNDHVAASHMCMASVAAASATPLPVSGAHWAATVGADHAFGLSSTLLGGDVITEQFMGLYDRIDITVEIGVRRQWSPTLVLDAGVSRHLVGAVQSTAVTLGGTYAVSLAR